MKLRILPVCAITFLVGISAALAAREAKLIEKEGKVIVTKLGAKPAPAVVGLGLVARDKLGTGALSRAVLQMTEKWMARIDEETDLEITASALATDKIEALKVQLGGAFIFSRESESELRVEAPSATLGIRGTQLFIRVFPSGRMQTKVIEGEVDVHNEHGRVLLKTGESADVEPGKAPRKTASIVTRNLLQWALYYPAVLQPDELGMPEAEKRAVAESLAAYREGDLLGALEKYPRGHRPASEGGKAYRAAVLLATGRVEKARAVMREMPATSAARRALERMISAVLFEERPEAAEPKTAGEALAESYYQQSRSQLEKARAMARRATEIAPESGYAWTRLGELEFSFARTHAAHAALERALKLTPRNAQAQALRGFVLAAENRIVDARAAFETAIRLDGALGNGWLGRGLTKTKKGDLAGGRADLQTASVVEANVSFFHSYFGKALSMEGLDKLARKDLDLARQLDPKDPTPWLYSAIQNQQENRYNEAIDDLRESILLNDNRRVYRSHFLLDQDRAVRSANLAKIYQNDGMNDVALREATRAVESDYTNASAHLFLANSFDALRDPTRISLRYETAWFNELLLANLLSPVGGGPLSQFVSQQEYSKLLEADGFGGSATNQWRDDGQLRSQESVFGTFGKLSFGLDFAYFYDNGHRPNNGVSREEVYWQAKYQATPDDIFYTLGQWQDNESGDLFQSYSDGVGSPGFDFEEKQEPGQLILGWNHRWVPGVHTLLLGGRQAADQVLADPVTTQALLQRAGTPGLDRFFQGTQPLTQNPDGSLVYPDAFLSGIAPFTGRGLVTSLDTRAFSFFTQRQFEIYSGEIQNIWEAERNTLILGGRYQSGEFETDTSLTALLASDSDEQQLFSKPAARQHAVVDFERWNIYAYDFVKVTPWLTLIGGVTWDQLDHPDNFRNPPVNARTDRDERWSGKGGFTLSPARWLTIRGLYTEAQGGVTFEDSLRLEPVQLAGFNQSYRTIISESIAGSVEAPVYHNWGISAEGELPTRTWWGASLNILAEDVKRTVGTFDGFTDFSTFPVGFGYVPGGTPETLAYREEVFSAMLNQIVGRQFAFGVGYRHTRAELRDTFPQILPLAASANVIQQATGKRADRLDEAALHELLFSANWNSPTGVFARAEARWYSQDLDGTVSGERINGLPGDDFWQFDVSAGYRFHRNLCEISAGVLNLSDTNYQLSPLTYTNDIPRERTFVVRCRLSF